MNKTALIFTGLVALILSACNGNGKPDAYGIIDAEDWMVASSEAGQVISLEIKEGSRLSKNQPVGLIDTTQLHIQLDALKAQIVSLRQTLPDVGKQMDVLKRQKESIQNEIARVKPLVGSGSASSKQLERLQEELRMCESQEAATRSSLGRETASVLASITALEAQADVLKDKISRSIIVNPENGTVSGLFVKKHEFVSPGMPIYKLSDYDNMFVDCWFDTAALSTVRLGDTVDVLPDSANGIVIEGTVVHIAEESEFVPNKVMTRDTRERFVYKVRVALRNDGSLKAGMPAEIYLRSDK